jgi:secreted trypsin-like serine protease
VGGEDATLGQFPWLVNLGYKRNGAGEALFKCGGSLIGPRHVVTAAHCVTDLPAGFDLAVIRVGEHDLAMEQDCQSGVCSPPPQDIPVESVVFHPSYGKPHAFQNDIAVIALAEEVEQSKFVAPVCLPFLDAGNSYLIPKVEGEHVDVAGWGATTETGRRPATVLQTLGLSVTDGEKCKEVYSVRGGVLSPSQICAGGERGRVSGSVDFPV